MTKSFDCQVQVTANDLLSGPSTAHIRETSTNTSTMLLEFIPPVEIEAEEFQFAVAAPRHECDNVDTLLKSGTLLCAITCVPKNQFDPQKPFNLSWWRGGGALIADIILFGGVSK